MPTIFTSESHPIRVDWIPEVEAPGRFGLTLAPGKHLTSIHSGGRWQRDLAVDLDRLVQHFHAEVLVCLLEDREFTSLGIADYIAQAEARGLQVRRLPIRDTRTPRDVAAFERVLAAVDADLAAGRHVVAHCAGGLGRAGTFGGCLLVRRGMAPAEALAVLRKRRDPKCPETPAQIAFVEGWPLGTDGAQDIGDHEGVRATGADPVAPAALDLLLDRARHLVGGGAPGSDRDAARRAARTLAEIEDAVLRDPARHLPVDAAGHAWLRVADDAWRAGHFEPASIGALRRRAAKHPSAGHGAVRFSVLHGTGAAADIGALQGSAAPGTLFQVASQFNGLEATSAHVTSIRNYPHDNTQGPRASVSAFPGTFLRHYRAPSDAGPFVQGEARCLDFLADALDPDVAEVRAGYLQSARVQRPERLGPLLEERFERIRVGVHAGVEVGFGAAWDGPVTEPAPVIAQVFTSTLALGGYSHGGSDELRAACRPLLRAAYLGTLLAAVSLEQSVAVLTLIGGGVFGNDHAEIHDAIRWALEEVQGLATTNLDVVLNLHSGELTPELEAEVARRGGELREA